MARSDGQAQSPFQGAAGPQVAADLLEALALPVARSRLGGERGLRGLPREGDLHEAEGIVAIRSQHLAQLVIPRITLRITGGI